MQVIKKPEDGAKFVSYEEDGNRLIFGEDDLSINLKRRERDYDVSVDICRDWTGGIVASVPHGERYLAQIFIPARQYTDEDTGEVDEETGRNIIEHKAVPFSMDNVILTLWEEE